MSETEREDLELTTGEAGEETAVESETRAAANVPLDTAEPAEETTEPDAAPEADINAAADSAEGEALDVAEGDQAQVDGEPEPLEPEDQLAPGGLEKKWYVVHTYSGYENKANKTLLERIKRDKMEPFFGQILVPTEEVVEMKRGKRRTSKRKFFPGYMLVQMAMTEETWYLVKSTPKITGFVGDSTHPSPVPVEEVARITNQIAAGAERVIPKIIFEKGDSVRVMDGPFANFNGVVDDVDQEKGKLRVLVSIFGRATPVEMDFIQVEKT